MNSNAMLKSYVSSWQKEFFPLVPDDGDLKNPFDTPSKNPSETPKNPFQTPKNPFEAPKNPFETAKNPFETPKNPFEAGPTAPPRKSLNPFEASGAKKGSSSANPFAEEGVSGAGQVDARVDRHADELERFAQILQWFDELIVLG